MEKDIYDNDKSIVIIGLPGAGKSVLGRKLAFRLNLPFVDSDTEVEKEVGCSITEIFKYNGEEYFRDVEKRVIDRLLNGEPQVLATGGGAFMDNDTFMKIKEQGISIWFRANKSVLLERISRRNVRPMFLDGNKEQTLEELIEQREPIYRKADIVIETDAGDHNSVIDNTVKKIKEAIS